MQSEIPVSQLNGKGDSPKGNRGLMLPLYLHTIYNQGDKHDNDIASTMFVFCCVVSCVMATRWCACVAAAHAVHLLDKHRDALNMTTTR